MTGTALSLSYEVARQWPGADVALDRARALRAGAKARDGEILFTRGPVMRLARVRAGGQWWHLRWGFVDVLEHARVVGERG